MGPFELDSVAAAADDADQTIDFTNDFEMDADETLYLAVIVDVDDDLGVGETNDSVELGAAIDISGFVAEDANGDTLTNSTDVVPTSDLYEGAQRAVAAALTITLSNVPGDVTTIHGMEDVTVGKFNFTGGDAGDVTVSSITMDVYLHDLATGDFAAGDCAAGVECTATQTVTDYLSSCNIYDNEDNLLDGPKSPSSSGSLLVFDDVNWTITAGEAETLELTCDFANPTGTTHVFFAFDLHDVSELVLAEDDDGADVDPTSDSVNGDYSSPTNVVTLEDAGSVAIAASSSTPSSGIVLTETFENHVASYEITSTNEDMEVTVFTVSEEEAEDDNGTSDSDAYTNNISLVTIEYPLEDGTTGSATATMNGNEAKFSLSSAPIYVDVSDPAIVDVYVDVSETDRNPTGSATANEKISMGFFVDVTNADNFKAIGIGSGFAYTDTDSDGAGSDLTAVETGIGAFIVKETEPTISLSSSSPSGTSVPGDIEVFRFNVAAAGNEDVVLDKLMWSLATSDNVGNSWDFCDTDDTTNGHIDGDIFDLYNLSKEGTSTTLAGSWSVLDSGGEVCTVTGDAEEVDYVRLDLTTSEVIPAGSTYTYSLYMETTYASATNDDVIQLTLASDPIVAAASFITTSVSALDAPLTLTATNVPVTLTAAYSEGDIICLDNEDNACDADDELALVTAVVTDDYLTVVRGYAGTNPVVAGVSGDDVDRLPSALFWQDDGTTPLSNDDAWGAYLVSGLPLTGNPLQF